MRRGCAWRRGGGHGLAGRVQWRALRSLCVDGVGNDNPNGGDNGNEDDDSARDDVMLVKRNNIE